MITFPKEIPILKDEIILLKKISSNDLAEYYKLYSDKNVMHAYGLFHHKNLAETVELIESLEKNFINRQMMRWGIFEMTHPEKIIGDIGFWRFVDVRNRAELGAKLSKEFWRHGYISRAINLVSKYGFEEMQLNSIEGNIEPSNIASCEMVKKLGFIQEGYLKKHSYNPITKKYADTILFTLRADHEGI